MKSTPESEPYIVPPAPPLASPPTRVRVRPPVRPPPRVSRGQFVRRAFQLLLAGIRLMFFAVADSSLGGDALAREMIRARRLRTELERLGGIFVKVGQLLSVRTDQYPWEVCREFAQLLDHATAFPSEVAIAILEEELRAPLGAVFSRFDPQPLASASIGQVHVAWLRDGTKVAIKIQRPGVAAETKIDLRLLAIFATVLDAVNMTKSPRLSPMIAELRRVMDEELSYITEARATYDFGLTLKKRKHVYSPKVYFDYTTDRVLTMEFIEGLPASALIKAIENQDQEALDRFEQLGIRRKKLARRFYRAILEQLYEHDISHSDPHPGNLIIMPGNKLCFIDFGAVSYFGPTFRARLERVTLALGARDVDAAVDATLASWEPLPLRDVDRFKSELKPSYQRLITNSSSKHGDPSLKSNGRVFVESARVAAKYGFQAPWDHLRFVRLLWEFDTTVVALDPDFNFLKAMRKYYRDRSRRTLKRNTSRGSLKEFLASSVNILSSLPKDVQELRYQAFSLMRRSDHLFINSISKMSYLGKLLLDSALFATLAAAGALAYFRVTLGSGELDRWLGEHLPIALPWWICALALVYLIALQQRMRMRVTDIDSHRG